MNCNLWSSDFRFHSAKMFVREKQVLGAAFMKGATAGASCLLMLALTNSSLSKRNPRFECVD
jgi:hypothetical protein